MGGPSSDAYCVFSENWPQILSCLKVEVVDEWVASDLQCKACHDVIGSVMIPYDQFFF